MVLVGETWGFGQETKPPPAVIDPNHHNGEDKSKGSPIGRALAIMAVGAAVGAATLIFVDEKEPYRIFLLSIGGVIAGRGVVELLL